MAFDKADFHVLTRREVMERLHCGNSASQTVAKTVLGLWEFPGLVGATREECLDVFDQLAQNEWKAVNKELEEAQGGIQGPVLG